MKGHNPTAFSEQLSAKLATASRHVCTLLGAGSSRACGLPDVAALQSKVLQDLEAESQSLFSRQLSGRTLEGALSRVRRIAALLEGDQSLDGLTSAAATTLDKEVCRSIVRHLHVDDIDRNPASNFAAWIGRTHYSSPLEVFTVNYDLLIESALDQNRVPYFDGFIGVCEAEFHTELVEAWPGLDRNCVPAFYARLWKLHGSVNWAWKGESRVVRLGVPASEDPAAIYPSDAKYDESRRVPFVVLQDRLRRSLLHPETLCIIAGYSFGDEHVNDLVFRAAASRERSEIVAFCFGAIPDDLLQRALRTPNLQVVGDSEAVLGGVRGKWEAASASENIWDGKKCLLPDFRHLAAFLAKSASWRSGEADMMFEGGE